LFEIQVHASLSASFLSKFNYNVFIVDDDKDVIVIFEKSKTPNYVKRHVKQEFSQKIAAKNA